MLVTFFVVAKSKDKNELIEDSIRKREPEIYDIFNKENRAQLIKMFEKHKEGDTKMLSRFLGERKTSDIINESYNCSKYDNYGAINL